jgi:5'-3' exonuclease
VPYKGHRPTSKPTHFNDVNVYLLNRFKAEVIEGKEADDALGYEHLAKPDTTVICTTDKDLLGVPGAHFYWGRNNGPKRLKLADYPYDEVFYVTEDEANKFFYTQLLTGDSADNIKGLKGIGPKRAKDILADCTTARELYEECAGQYEQGGLTNEQLVENAYLLWIQREKDVMWEVPSAV